MVLGVFLAMCMAIFLVASPDEKEAQEDQNPALTKLKSSVSKAKSASRALSDNNYGDAQAHLTALQDELSELIFLLAENE